MTANKDYTLQIQFRKQELKDDEGYVINFKDGEDDTVGIIETQVRAGSKARGEVYLRGEWNGHSMEIDSEYNITYFKKPTFVNEHLLNEYDWVIGIGLVEGISWEHWWERRTKWRCEVMIPKDDFKDITSKNLRDLEMRFEYDECDHEHPIDFACVRPLVLYEYEGKEYVYYWDDIIVDIHYPPEGWEEETPDTGKYEK